LIAEQPSPADEEPPADEASPAGQPCMDLVDQFMARYTKEYDFYNQTARLAHQKLESNLQAAGIRSIVTSRAKSIARLEDKCRQRGAKRDGYKSIDEIYDDIVDLAGVRVALYFPAEIDQVDGTITRLFDVIFTKGFPDTGPRSRRCCHGCCQRVDASMR
jgi:ppGpp synthetase/RelA/SpoT-type nucleotidyltranferase